MNVMKDAKKSMKKMKNTDEEYECMQREYVGKNFQVKSESEKWCPIYMQSYWGQNGHVRSNFHTLGNVKILSWNDTPDDTCGFIMSEKA